MNYYIVQTTDHEELMVAPDIPGGVEYLPVHVNQARGEYYIATRTQLPEYVVHEQLAADDAVIASHLAHWVRNPMEWPEWRTSDA